MSFPIRCFTCGKVTGNLFEKFHSYSDKEHAYKDLDITRYCCKRTLLTSIDTFNDEIVYHTASLNSCIKVKKEHSTNRVFGSNKN